MKAILVVCSYHHHNTEKIAGYIAGTLGAQIVKPDEIAPEELQHYDLVGLGSGIYSAKHDPSLLKFAKSLPVVRQKHAFIFSTSAIVTPDKVDKDHETLRKILQSRGYAVVDEFSCPGFNTNSFLRFFGGMNKGRPNTEDCERAKQFARNLIRNYPTG
jgi:flavodoxin